MSKHLESLYQNLLNGKLPHNLSWSETFELVEPRRTAEPLGTLFRDGHRNPPEPLLHITQRAPLRVLNCHPEDYGRISLCIRSTPARACW